MFKKLFFEGDEKHMARVPKMVGLPNENNFDLTLFSKHQKNSSLTYCFIMLYKHNGF